MLNKKKLFVCFALLALIHSICKAALIQLRSEENGQKTSLSKLSLVRDDLLPLSIIDDALLVTKRTDRKAAGSFTVILKGDARTRTRFFDEGLSQLLINRSFIPSGDSYYIKRTTVYGYQKIEFPVQIAGNHFQLTIVGQEEQLPDILFTDSPEELLSDERQEPDLEQLSTSSGVTEESLDNYLPQPLLREPRQAGPGDRNNTNDGNDNGLNTELGIIFGVSLPTLSLGEVFWFIGSLKGRHGDIALSEFTVRNALRIFSYFLTLGISAVQDFLIFIIYYAVKRKALDWQWIPNKCC